MSYIFYLKTLWMEEFFTCHRIFYQLLHKSSTKLTNMGLRKEEAVGRREFTVIRYIIILNDKEKASNYKI